MFIPVHLLTMNLWELVALIEASPVRSIPRKNEGGKLDYIVNYTKPFSHLMEDNQQFYTC